MIWKTDIKKWQKSRFYKQSGCNDDCYILFDPNPIVTFHLNGRVMASNWYKNKKK